MRRDVEKLRDWERRSRPRSSRRAPLPRVNRKRKAKMFERNFGARAALVRAMGCAVEGCREQPQAAHAIARGKGGAKGSKLDLVPLCARHHAEAGEARTSARADFEARHGLDLLALAADIDLRISEVLPGSVAAERAVEVLAAWQRPHTCESASLAPARVKELGILVGWTWAQIHSLQHEQPVLWRTDLADEGRVVKLGPEVRVEVEGRRQTVRRIVDAETGEVIQ